MSTASYKTARVHVLLTEVRRLITGNIAPHTSRRPRPGGQADPPHRRPAQLSPVHPGPDRPAGADVMRRHRYSSDTTDLEWVLIEPLLPVPACQTSRGDRPEAHPRREIVDALRHLVDTGCKWSPLPSDYPPFKTVFGFFTRWSAAGVFNLIRDQLRRRIRRSMGTSPHPVAAVIDSQPAKVAATVPRSTSGYGTGKRTPGRKRHTIVDLKPLPLFVMVSPADMHDSVAVREALFRLRLTHPEITVVWADLAYSDTLVDWAKSFLHLTVRTVSRPKSAKGFV